MYNINYLPYARGIFDDYKRLQFGKTYNKVFTLRVVAVVFLLISLLTAKAMFNEIKISLFYDFPLYDSDNFFLVLILNIIAIIFATVYLIKQIGFNRQVKLFFTAEKHEGEIDQMFLYRTTFYPQLAKKQFSHLLFAILIEAFLVINIVLPIALGFSPMDKPVWAVVRSIVFAVETLSMFGVLFAVSIKNLVKNEPVVLSLKEQIAIIDKKIMATNGVQNNNTIDLKYFVPDDDIYQEIEPCNYRYASLLTISIAIGFVLCAMLAVIDIIPSDFSGYYFPLFSIVFALSVNLIPLGYKKMTSKLLQKQRDRFVSEEASKVAESEKKYTLYKQLSDIDIEKSKKIKLTFNIMLTVSFVLGTLVAVFFPSTSLSLIFNFGYLIAFVVFNSNSKKLIRDLLIYVERIKLQNNQVVTQNTDEEVEKPAGETQQVEVIEEVPAGEETQTAQEVETTQTAETTETSKVVETTQTAETTETTEVAETTQTAETTETTEVAETTQKAETTVTTEVAEQTTDSTTNLSSQSTSKTQNNENEVDLNTNKDLQQTEKKTTTTSQYNMRYYAPDEYDDLF